MSEWPSPEHVVRGAERCVCYDHPDCRTITRMVGKLPEEWQRRLIGHLSALYIDGRLNDGCPHCSGTGLVEDKSWQPDFPGDRRIEGEAGHGYLRCGSGCELIDGSTSS